MASPLANRVKAVKEPKPEMPPVPETPEAEAPPAKPPKAKKQKKPKLADVPVAKRDEHEKFRFPDRAAVACVYSDGTSELMPAEYAAALRRLADHVEANGLPSSHPGAKNWSVVLGIDGQYQPTVKSGIHYAIHTLGRMWHEAQKALEPTTLPDLTAAPLRKEDFESGNFGQPAEASQDG
jgi:type IV secretory pathway VirB10-like protein